MSFYLWFYCISPAASHAETRIQVLHTNNVQKIFFFKALNMRHSCTRRQVLRRSQGGWTAVIGADCCRIVTLTALAAQT